VCLVLNKVDFSLKDLMWTWTTIHFINFYDTKKKVMKTDFYN
jgi:hypothetical protein